MLDELKEEKQNIEVNENFRIDNINVVENKIAVNDFINLRKLVNFIEYKEKDIEVALKNTLYSITIYYENNPIGIARIVGDDRIVFFIKDVVVHPLYKGKHIGKILMLYLFKYIEKKACINAYIGLMATPNTEGFYEQFGFIKRPNEHHGAGMIMYYHGGKIYEENSSVR